MSYHEIDLNRHSMSVSYGICLLDWSLPMTFGVGGSGMHERGVSVSLLCFWFALRWWPRDYPVVGDSGAADAWTKQFNPDRDPEQLLIGLDIEASSLEASVRRVRNTLALLTASSAQDAPALDWCNGSDVDDAMTENEKAEHTDAELIAAVTADFRSDQERAVEEMDAEILGVLLSKIAALRLIAGAGDAVTDNEGGEAALAEGAGMSADVKYALRLPKKVHAAMKRAAKEDDRSLNYMIVRACEEFVRRRANASAEGSED